MAAMMGEWMALLCAKINFCPLYAAHWENRGARLPQCKSLTNWLACHRDVENFALVVTCWFETVDFCFFFDNPGLIVYSTCIKACFCSCVSGMQPCAKCPFIAEIRTQCWSLQTGCHLITRNHSGCGLVKHKMDMVSQITSSAVQPSSLSKHFPPIKLKSPSSLSVACPAVCFWASNSHSDG